METVYKAIDGKIFDDEYECMDYENNLFTKDNTLILLNKDGDEIEIDNDSLNIFDDITNCLEKSCYYLGIKTEKDLKLIEKISDCTGIDYPNEVGLFWYNDDTDVWENSDKIKEKLKKYQKEINKIKNIMKKMG